MRYIRTLAVLAVLLMALGALPALAQGATSISIGEEVIGSLTAARPQAEYTFAGEAGQLVTITLISEDFDSYLTLNDPDGIFLASDDDSAGNLNSRIGPLSLPANGTYTIIAASLSGSATGDYTLTLETPQVETIAYGDVVEGSLTLDAPAATYYFEAEPGDVVAIRLNSEDFDSYLELRSAAGSFMVSDDDGGGNLNSLIGPLTLEGGGTYIITARSLGGTSTGKYTLSFTQAELAPLTFDTPVDAELAAGEALYFAFDAESGQVVDIVVDSGNTIDSTLTVRGPEGYQVAYNDDSSAGIDPQVLATVLNSTGTYIVMVQGRYEDESGPLTVTLSGVQLPSLDDGPQRVRLSDKQSSARLTFSGAAGDSVRLTFTLDSGSTLPSYVDIRQGDFSLVYISGERLGELSLVLNLDADGNVVLDINDYSYSVKIVSVTLERLNAE